MSETRRVTMTVEGEFDDEEYLSLCETLSELGLDIVAETWGGAV